MNDDNVSARDEAASAYLDGDLDATERASVSADPETMARVEAFMQLRKAMTDTEPIADEVRDSAISAALAAFDVRQQIIASAPAHAAHVSVLRTRWQRSTRVLGGLAAAAVIAVVAVAALNATNGEDMKSSSSATAPINAAESQRTEMAAASTPAAGGAPAGTSAAAGTTPPAASTKIAAAELPAVNSEADLAQFASGFATAADAATAAPAPADSAMSTATELMPVPAVPPSTCLGANDVVLGPISVLGAPAWAIRDISTGVVRAIGANDCRVLLSTGP